jgi:hypothetical protein
MRWLCRRVCGGMTNSLDLLPGTPGRTGPFNIHSGRRRRAPGPPASGSCGQARSPAALPQHRRAQADNSAAAIRPATSIRLDALWTRSQPHSNVCPALATLRSPQGVADLFGAQAPPSSRMVGLFPSGTGISSRNGNGRAGASGSTISGGAQYEIRDLPRVRDEREMT